MQTSYQVLLGHANTNFGPARLIQHKICTFPINSLTHSSSSTSHSTFSYISHRTIPGTKTPHLHSLSLSLSLTASPLLRRLPRHQPLSSYLVFVLLPMAATASSNTNNSNDVVSPSEGPVLNLINKRLRALRKKLNRIAHTEESLSQGKPINKEQEEVLRSKPSVLASIDELEKLRTPLQSALAEELALARTTAATNPQTLAPENTGSSEDKPNDAASVSALEDILNLLYFGSLFDVKSQSDFASTMLTRTHERGCCLTYDYVTDDATDLLREKDLDLIAAMRGLLISRPADSSLSHKNALQRCIEHAKLWLARADQPIEANADVTYAGLRERLSKIMSSEYFTTTPEMKATVEVAAAAAAAGNYSSYPVEVEVEGSDSQSQGKDEGTANFHGHGSGDDQYDPEGQHQKDEVQAENAVEVVSVEHEQTVPLVDGEHNQQDVEAKEQQHYHRRGYQNQRGGRGGSGFRRGYSNGRGGRGGGGGRGYQNGRNQYYDQQPGNYYPRNYNNNRGRGGGRGGGYSYNNHGPGGQVNHVANDVGVQS